MLSCSGEREKSPGRARRGEFTWPPSIVCLLAYALRAYRLGELSLWYDEGWSVHLAQLAPWRALLQIMGSGHTHPPLYYLLLGLWQALGGPSELSMRFLSLAFGVLVVALGYRLGYELSEDRPSASDTGRGSRGGSLARITGLTAALLLALAPSQIVYAQEARSYTLFALEYAALILLTSRFLRRQWRISWGGWATLILAEAIGLYTHYFAVVLLAYLGGVTLSNLIWHRWWPALWRWMAAQFLVGLLYLPWAQTALRQLGGHERPDMQALSLRPFLGLVWRFHFSGLSWAAARYPHLVQATLALAILGAASFLVNALLRRSNRWDWLILGSFVLPLGAVFAIEQMRPGLHPRYTFMLSVPLLVLLARQTVLWVSSGRVAQKLVGAGMGTAILLNLALGLQAMDKEYHKDDVRALAAHLNAEATAQDLILFDYEDFAFEYYYRGQAPVLYLEGYGPPEPLLQRVLREAQGRERAFLVTWYTGHTDRREMYPFLLELNGHLDNSRSFRGLHLREFALELPAQAPMLIPMSADYGPFRLTGAFRETTVPADGAVAMALRWRLEERVDTDYKAAVILRDPLGRQIASVDNPLTNDQGRPTAEWVAGVEVENYAVIPIPVGTPPLTHTLHVALYAEDALAEDGEPLDLLSETGAPSGKHFALGEVALSAPSIPQRDPYRTQDQLMLRRVGEEVATGLRLEAVGMDRTSAQPGRPIPIILLWQATENGLPDHRPALRLLRADPGSDGETLAQQRGAPADGRYPTSLWRKGELCLDRRELMVDPHISEGEARLEVRVGNGQPLALATITIEEAAGHLFELPSTQYEVYARFGDIAELVGYDLPVTRARFRGRGSEAISVTLYWRAIGEGSPSTSYTVFAHLLTEGGERLVAQHDGPPAEGRQPTTSWVQGEIIVDPHSLHWWQQYTGTCPIEVGLYDPATGERLAVYDREGSRLPYDRLILDRSVICATEDGP